MRPKIRDLVKHPTKSIIGQIEKIRNTEVLVRYSTSEVMRFQVSQLEFDGQQWRVND